MNDTNDIWAPVDANAIDDGAPAAPPRAHRRASGMDKAKLTGALILGGVAGAAILGPLSALAASPAPAASSGTTSGAGGSGGSTGTGTSGAAASDAPDHARGGPGGFGHTEAVSDTSVVAKAIGISEADLLTALQGGQTVAAVAKAQNVDIQVVIDALVADGQAELDAAVKAGTITQAQADAEKANLTQRATDQANGTFGGGH